MRVALIHDGSTRWLAGDPGKSEREHTSAADLEIEAVIVSEIDNYIRAARAKPRDRKNLQTTYRFGTTRLFDTAAEAEVWSADYDAAFPRTGSLRLQSLLPGGGQQNRYLNDAVVLPPRRQVIGCSVILSYTVQGSDITSMPRA